MIEMDRICKAFQEANWNTPGWKEASSLLVSLRENGAPKTFPEKADILIQALKVAKEDEKWIPFLVAISDEL